MDYETFCKKLKELCSKHPEWHLTDDGIRLMRKGDTADDERGQNTIRSTNLKYFRTESDVLMDDFLILFFCTTPDTAKSITNVSRFSVQDLYHEFSAGGWERVTTILCDSVKAAAQMDPNNILANITNYNLIKDSLIIRPINYTDNKYELKDYFYKTVGDIALVLYLLLSDEHMINTSKLPKEAMDSWEVDADTVWEEALINTNARALPRLYMSPAETFNPPFELGAFMSFNNTIPKISRTKAPTITTTKQVNGAIAMFYPGVQEKIAELFDGSYYVAFTSIHEAHVHHKDTISPRTILGTLKNVNRTFDKKEILSRKVFYYDKENRTFQALEL